MAARTLTPTSALAPRSASGLAAPRAASVLVAFAMIGSAAPAHAAEPAPAEAEDAAELPAAELPAAELELAVPELPARRPPPPEHGPFYADEPPSDTAFPSDRPLSKPPLFSLGGGAFCFLEDAKCRAALLASAEIAAGTNIVAGDRGVDVPLTHYGVRAGFTVRPITLARGRWNRWAVGAAFTAFRNSGTIAAESSTMGTSNPDYLDTRQNDGIRVGLVNQLWLSQRRHAPHLDVTFGVVRSRVLTSRDKYLGTHADVALGVGGWGAFFLSGDFLDQDVRLTFGVRGHAIAAGPLVGLILLGMLAASGGAM